MARLLLGVTGGIAAYKALEAVRLATQAGHAVRVIQTERSLQFVGRASFSALTSAPVLIDEFEPDPARGAYPGEALPAHAPISHLALVERADAYLVAPATANTLARLAHGFASDLLSTAALAAPCPVAVAPAMNHRMWEHAATRANVELLRERGVTVIEPDVGRLASHGEYGAGRLAEPARLVAIWEQLAGGRPWRGVRVLVTAGGTREPLDSVRYLGNRSSGRMGVALAAAAHARGAEVTLIGANLAVPVPPGVRSVSVGTAADLADACEQEFPVCDVLLMSAAVADFRPAAPSAVKLRKEQGAPSVELQPTVDVLALLASRRRPEQTLIGFAAEDGDIVSGARGKLQRKGLDAVAVNDISVAGIGFDSDENEITIVTAERERLVPRCGKRPVAEAILDEVELIRATRRDRGESDAGSSSVRLSGEPAS